MSSSPTLAAPGLSERFTWIIELLCNAAASRAGLFHYIAPVILELWPYLKRTARRFEALLARLESGRPFASRAPRQPAARPAAPRPAAKPYPQGMPRSFAWLLQVVPESRSYASQLRHLLADPDMAALLAASPQAGRILRPLCRMLGITPEPGIPPALFLSRATPPSAVAPSPAAPRPPSPAEPPDPHSASLPPKSASSKSA